MADGGSTDDTLAIARFFGCKIHYNDKVMTDYGTKLALDNATGDLFMVFAADNELVDTDFLARVDGWFSNMTNLSCLWGKLKASPDDPPIMRYYELIKSEPMAWFMNRNLDWYLLTSCIFNVLPDKLLCWGANGIVYRTKDIKDLWKSGYVSDNELFQLMVESGKTEVCYLKNLYIYHHTVKSIRHWISKWVRNYLYIYLPTCHERNIGWLQQGNFRCKLIQWLVYSLTPVAFLHSLWLALINWNIYWLYHSPLCFLQTVTYGVLWLRKR